MRHSDQVRYIVAVLFLHGAAETEIADLLKQYRITWLTKGQVSGIINRAGAGALRGLDKAGRQEWLNTMKLDRQDNGRLPPSLFIARERR